VSCSLELRVGVLLAFEALVVLDQEELITLTYLLYFVGHFLTHPHSTLHILLLLVETLLLLVEEPGDLLP